MDAKIKFLITLGVCVGLIALFFFVTRTITGMTGYSILNTQNQTSLDSLAKCLTEKGAKFYGAYWCPHCQAQKADFGTAASLLPYVECEPSAGFSPECQKAGVNAYPTWVINGTTYEGEQSPDKLKSLSGC